MGTWGPGVLQDDVAADIRLMFGDCLAGGMDVAAATAYVLEHDPWSGDDEDDCVTILALAALQLEQGALQPAMRERALAAAASEWAISGWEGSSPERVTARAAVLDRLQAILRRGTCTPDELHAVTAAPSMSTS